jgi:hypothetical protein
MPATTATTSTERARLVAAVLLAAAAIGCGPGDFVPEPTGAVCPPDSPLTYDGFGRPFFDRYCQRCHASTVIGSDRRGAPATRFYDTVDRIRTDPDIDMVAAAGPDAFNDDMPRGRPRPTDEERFQLGEWLACGAP